LKDGAPFVHAHALFGREDGSTFGGHLMAPTTVFAAEAYAAALHGPPPERIYDAVTGLYLWAETP
jgi:predicted DNA-binding protein with PD1-like motif